MKLADLYIKLGLKNSAFNKKLNDSKKSVSSFVSNLSKIAKTVTSVFAVKEVAAFISKMGQLSGEVDNVSKAFYKFATQADLTNLRNSVQGTVTDLDLMKRAVLANNFGIPIKNLGTLFEFANKRARETGESVDYLVNSIVTGIARKSPLILDNLGISAVKLKENLDGVSASSATVGQVTEAVMKIAQEDLNKTGKLAETLGTTIEKLSAKWSNFQAAVASGGAKTALGKTLDRYLSGASVILDLLTDQLTGTKNAMDDLADPQLAKNILSITSGLNVDLSGGDDATKNLEVQQTTLEELIKELPIYQKKYQDALSSYKETKNFKFAEYATQLSKAIKAISTEIDTKQSQKSLKELETELDNYTAKYKEAFANYYKTGNNQYVEDANNLVPVISKINELIKQKKADLAQTKENISQTDLYADAVKQAYADAKKALSDFQNSDQPYSGEKNAQDYIDKLEQLKEAVDSAKYAVNALSRSTDEVSIKPLESISATSVTPTVGTVNIDTSALANMDSYYAALQAKLKALKAMVDSEGSDFQDSLNNALTSGIDNIITSAFEGIGEAIVSGDISDFTDSVLSALGSFMEQMGALFIAYGVGVVAFFAAFSNPAALIAAGAALVTIGAAISALASGSSSSTSSSSTSSVSTSSSSTSSNNSTDTSSSSTRGTTTNKIEVYGSISGNNIVLSSKRTNNKNDLVG